MRALTMVAHPDDCIIYAYGFMKNFDKFDWTVCYLTYTATDYRGKELHDFWQRRNVDTVFLGYNDTYQDFLDKKISFDVDLASNDIKSVIKDFDLVLTHDHQGDYDHPHHRFVNQVVCNNHSYVICFAGSGAGNVKYCVDPGTYDLEELPQHKDVIAQIHKDTHTNEYTLTERVKKLL